MPFKKGQSGNPTGRKKGVPNKMTLEMREVIKAAVQGQVGQLGAMIDEARHGIEIEKVMPDGTTVVGRFNADSAKAAQLVLNAAEYCIPRLQRIEKTLDSYETEELVQELRRRLNGAAPPEPEPQVKTLDS